MQEVGPALPAVAAVAEAAAASSPAGFAAAAVSALFQIAASFLAGFAVKRGRWLRNRQKLHIALGVAA